MKSALFAMVPAYGHINPTLKIANYLTSQGYRIIFLSTKFFQKYIEDNGFIFVDVKSFPFGLPINNYSIDNLNKKTFYKNYLDRKQNQNYNKRYSQYIEIINTYNVKIVIVDHFFKNDVVILQNITIHFNFKYFFFQTQVPEFKTYFSNSNFSNKSFTFKSLINLFFSSFLRIIGLDDLSIVRKSLAGHEEVLIPEKSFDGTYKYLGVIEIISVPSEFDPYFKSCRKNQYYIGSIIDFSPKIFNDKLNNKLKEWSKIIYCSFGTFHTVQVSQDYINNFYDSLRQAITHFNDYFFFISLGNKTFETWMQRDNVLYSNFLPQKDILKYSDLVITHCGINTILEAISNGKPILACPNSSTFDQEYNAFIVQNMKLGIICKRKGNHYDLISSINTLILDQEFTNRSIKLSHELKLKYNNKFHQKIFDKIFFDK